MATKIPITIEGNLTSDPDYGVAENGTKYARFSVATNDRRLNDESGEWEDAGEPKFHRTSVFGRQAENVRDSLRKGDGVLLTGELQFTHWKDTNSGEDREGTQIIADAVGPSLRRKSATVNRSSNPKVDGPDASATGPSVIPNAAATVGVAR